jgi:hypothetical protein
LVIILNEQELFERVAGWRDHKSLNSLSVAAVAEIAGTEGTDFATALLYTRILESERFGPGIELVRRSPHRWTSSRLSPLLAVVPGAFHAEHMDTGADGRRFLEISRAHGFQCEVIPTHSFGSLRQNASIASRWLAGRREQELVLVCLSKAAAEVACLLGEEDTSQLRGVAATLNLSPMMFGSPLVDRVLDHPVRRICVRCFMWYKNYDVNNLAELRYKPDVIPSPKPPFPILNVSGFPLERHLSSPMARRQYRRLRQYGPNDGGGVLLADLIRSPGGLFPVWSADHYLRRPENFPDVLGQVLFTIATNAHSACAACVSS